MTLPEILSVRKYSLNHLMHKCVLMHDDFWFLYTSNSGGKPSPKFYSLFKSVSIGTGGGN